MVNIPGCPPNPYNFLSTVLYLLTFGKPPELDGKNRPKFAYGRLVHENCERRPHFDAGRFALEFGDYGHRQGFCLYKLGCKGPETYANCPAIGFGDVGQGNWPVGIGHPCFGCTMEEVGFTKPIHALADVKTFTPPTAFPEVAAPKGTKAPHWAEWPWPRVWAAPSWARPRRPWPRCRQATWTRPPKTTAPGGSCNGQEPQTIPDPGPWSHRRRGGVCNRYGTGRNAPGAQGDAAQRRWDAL